jgi:glucosamine 6-phosphate synthetase-like amidotransferase/phosphosugar isomerase protein
MCGIVGAVSRVDVAPFLLKGLQRLEYRGVYRLKTVWTTEKGTSKMTIFKFLKT